MNREYNCNVSSKNSKPLLKNLQNTVGDYFFCPTLYIARGRAWTYRPIIVTGSSNWATIDGRPLSAYKGRTVRYCVTHWEIAETMWGFITV